MQNKQIIQKLRTWKKKGVKPTFKNSRNRWSPPNKGPPPRYCFGQSTGQRRRSHSFCTDIYYPCIYHPKFFIGLKFKPPLLQSSKNSPPPHPKITLGRALVLRSIFQFKTNQHLNSVVSAAWYGRVRSAKRSSSKAAEPHRAVVWGRFPHRQFLYRRLPLPSIFRLFCNLFSFLSLTTSSLTLELGSLF